MTLLISEASCLLSQREDYHWILGYKSFAPSPDSTYGRCEFIFSDTSYRIVKTHNVINKFDFTNASISDSTGRLLFYTNGLEVYDHYYKVMPNGDGLNPGEFATSNEELGYTLIGGAIILEYPNHPGKYFIIHHTIDRVPFVWYALNMLTTNIDMNRNGSKGDVVYKNHPVYSDSMGMGSLTACRHANGRDWWIVVFHYRGEKCFKFLLDPSGLHLDHIQIIPFSFYPSGSGNSVFSPDGTKFSFFHQSSQNYREFFLGDFDRCTGKLSNMQYGVVPGYALSGIAFSPNSKYLYLSTGNLLYQLDMDDSIPFETKIQIDSIDGFMSIPGFLSYFNYMQLAPNGKIYICNGRSPQHLSTIEQPDLKGRACDVRQHNILIIHNSTIPTFPYFRLGAMEGSDCDTLARGRLPIADWTGKQDSLNPVRFDFTDNSLYEVKEWSWDFGDPSSPDNKSNLQNPVHLFSKEGIYEVCLIAKNINGTDTLCKIVNIETVSAENENSDKYPTIRFTPNPCQDFLKINIADYNTENILFQLYNSLGKILIFKILNKETNAIDVTDLHPGIYFVSFLEKGITIKTEKLLKM